MTLGDMNFRMAVLVILATTAAAPIGVHAQGGAAAAAAARLAAPTQTGSMGALTKAASAVRTSRAAALAGKGLQEASSAGAGRTTQIMGYLWQANNNPLSNVSVQIRNVTTDAVEKIVTTDATGQFLFQNVQPGEYIIEYVNDSATKLLAVGHPFTVSPGETVATFVRLSNGLPMLLPNELSNLSSNVATQAVQSAADVGVTSVATPLVSVVPPVVPAAVPSTTTTTGGNETPPPAPPPVVSAIR